MKIGVDARQLSRSLTGIGRYTFEMCFALSQIDGISLFLYSPAPISSKFLDCLNGVTVRTKNIQSAFLRQIWGETYLPILARLDLVDVFWGPAHRLPFYLPANMPRVVTVHDLVWCYAGNTMRPLSRLRERYQMPLAVNSADAVVAISNSTKDAVKKEFSIDAKKLFHVPLGVRVEGIRPHSISLQELNISCPYILFVGTLEPRKNLVRLLIAYSKLVGQLKERIMLVIAGGKGWGKEDISKVVSDLGLAYNVVVLGYVDDQVLHVLYEHTMFLAMPSLYEGFGLPLIEAMAHGTPALTSDNSSMPEVAGDAALLVDAEDVNSINGGLVELISNPTLLSNLADNAKSNAARFNWDESAKQLISVFNEAISSRRS